MSWLEALILGVVQGLTEFLPVSSSGHIEIGQAILGTAGEENLTFAVIVHIATVFSTLVILWSEVSKLFRGTFTTMRWNAEKDYVSKILVSMVPIFIVGVFFKEEVESLFGEGLLLVGICLVLTALLLSVSEWLQNKRQGQGHEVGYKDAIIIGIAQAFAVLPGLSRSGTTIATGLLCGVKKESVAQFSSSKEYGFSLTIIVYGVEGVYPLSGVAPLKNDNVLYCFPLNRSFNIDFSFSLTFSGPFKKSSISHVAFISFS